MRLRRKASRRYGLRNYPPEKVAEGILRAVVGNRLLVPVTPESHLAPLLSPIAPRPLRPIARIGPPP